MPDSLISRFVFLESAKLTESRLRLRFIPERFDADHPDPIVLVETDLTVEIDKAAQKISQIEDEYIDDITVDDSSLSVYVETLDAPIQFQGPVTCKREDYAKSDYIAEIKRAAHIRDKQAEKIHQLGRTIDRALRFIDRTIDRIEKKQDLTQARSEDYADQIRLLRGARRHLADD